MDLSQLQVIYEDNHFIAVNKPAGVLVQGDETGDTPLGEFVKQYIKLRYGKPGDVFLGVVHRIDRPVSGVVIFARTTKGLQRLSELFKERLVKKTYFAISDARPDPIEGDLTHYLHKDTERNITKAYDSQNRNKAAKKAELNYELLSSIGNGHLIQVKPITGRPHQIRVQLARLGCPIRGDVKYGAKTGNKDNSIHLHSRMLEFQHPIKDVPVRIVAEPPRKDQVWQMFEQFY